MPIGICKLCLQTRVLQDSHLLPKALYRLSRNESSPNPNPSLVSRRGIVQTSRQVKDFVLCADCEQRFSKHGERYAMSQVNRKEGFALLDTLSKSTNHRTVGGFTFYYDTSTLGINRAKLAYFALSVFWRASVHVWHRPQHKTPMITLGQYEEPIRKYLLGDMSFPSEIATILYVCNDYHSQNIFYEPSKGNDGDPTTWTFQARGLNFFLTGLEGKLEQTKGTCLINGPRQIIISLSCEDKTRDSLSRIIHEARKRENMK